MYVDDFILPAGNLREARKGAKRANAIIVTKCPEGLSEKEQAIILSKINPLHDQKVYFTCIVYDKKVYAEKSSILLNSLEEKLNIRES